MGTLKECGRWQSSSKQKKHTAFFFANKGEKKKNPPITALHSWTHFIKGASWGAQRRKKHQDEAVDNQAMMQSHFAGVKTSITENQDQWADHMGKWIPEEYQTAARQWAKSKADTQGEVKQKHLESTLKQRLKQCNKAADSWATTACKHRLGATDAGGPGFQTATQASQRPPLGRGSSRHFLQAKHDCQGRVAGAHSTRTQRPTVARNPLLSNTLGIRALVKTKTGTIVEMWGPCHGSPTLAWKRLP